MKAITLFLVIALISATQLIGQQKEKKGSKVPEQTAPMPAATPRPALAFGLSEDTPVRLRLTETMSSASATVNERVSFDVIEDVKVKDVVVIQRGAKAIGTVTEAQPKRTMGRAGKLNINIDSVELVDGAKIPLRAVKGGNGGSHTGAMTGAIVATSIIFFPAAPFFLLMHGKDISIPKGTEISAFVASDIELQSAKFVHSSDIPSTGSVSTLTLNSQPASSTESDSSLSSAPPVVPAESPDASAVTIGSNPAGADITIDGKFMGSTPSTLKLAPGVHTLLIEKANYKSWEKALSVTANGNVSIDAGLELK